MQASAMGAGRGAAPSLFLIFIFSHIPIHYRNDSTKLTLNEPNLKIVAAILLAIFPKAIFHCIFLMAAIFPKALSAMRTGVISAGLAVLTGAISPAPIPIATIITTITLLGAMLANIQTNNKISSHHHAAASLLQTHARRMLFRILKETTLDLFAKVTPYVILIQRAWRVRKESKTSTVKLSPISQPALRQAQRPTTAAVGDKDLFQDKPPPLTEVVRDGHGAILLSGPTRSIVGRQQGRHKGTRQRGCNKSAVKESRSKVAAAQCHAGLCPDKEYECHPLSPAAQEASDNIITTIYPHMAPMADFSLEKCRALRMMITADMLLVNAPQLRTISQGLKVEAMARQLYPERHPGGSSTPLARYLCDYLKRVVATGSLIHARDDVYKFFAGHVNEQLRATIEINILNMLNMELEDDEPDADFGNLAKQAMRESFGANWTLPVGPNVST